MLDAGLFGVREKIFPVDGALTNVGHAAAKFNGLPHRTLVSGLRRDVLHPIFYVNKRETAGMLIEISQRILASDANPAEIQFHGDEFGIRFGEQEIVREFAAERLSGIEIERVIVVGELDAGFFAGFAGFVEEFGGALPAARFGTLFLVDPRADDIAVTHDLGGFESLRPLFFDDVVTRVAGRRGKTILVEDGADMFRRMAIVARVVSKNTGELDFLVAGGGDL